MKRTATELPEEDLNAFIDGELDPSRQDEIRLALADHAETAAYVEALRQQDEALRRLGDATLSEPVPERLRAVVRNDGPPDPPAGTPPAGPAMGGLFSWKGVSALATAAAAGLAIGWFGKDVAMSEPATLLGAYTEQAVLSHRLFETNREFDIPADDNGAIVIDDTIRPFSTPVRAPTVPIAGLTPVMVRHVEGDSGNAVHIAYKNGEDWTSLYIRQHTNDTRLPFRFREQGGYSVLYWLDGPLVYALVGSHGEGPLRTIAENIYRAPATSDLRQGFGGDFTPVGGD